MNLALTVLSIGLLLLQSAGLAATHPLVLAHRGASGYLPEHTLEAKAYAYALGADFLEQDVVLTRDHVPIVLHDITLDETTDVAEVFPERAREDGHFYAIDFDWAELQRLRVHERTEGRSARATSPASASAVRSPSATP